MQKTPIVRDFMQSILFSRQKKSGQLVEKQADRLFWNILRVPRVKRRT
jgi:hypothetical protein